MAKIAAWLSATDDADGLMVRDEILVFGSTGDYDGVYEININVRECAHRGAEAAIASIGITPQDAREIAAELLRLADAHDAKAGA
jgi:hypothetical protein